MAALLMAVEGIIPWLNAFDRLRAATCGFGPGATLDGSWGLNRLLQPASGLSARGETLEILWITLWVEQISKYEFLDFALSRRYDAASHHW